MTLGAWAARTTRVPLGVMVCGVGYRNVGLTVKMATALDHASDGRAMLGPGRRLARAGAPGVRLRDARPRRPDQPVRRGEPARPGDARRRARTRRTAAGSAPTRCATTRRRVQAADAAAHRRQRREADAADRGPRRRHLERRGRPRDVRPQERRPRCALRRDRARPVHDPADGRGPAGLHPRHRARRRSTRWPRSSRARAATRSSQARAWAASSPLADTQDGRRPVCSAPGGEPGRKRPSSTCRHHWTTRRSSDWPARSGSGSA